MTNEEKILNSNIYDLLVSMNKTIICKSHYETCVLESLEQKHIDCGFYLCEECIRNYLESEVAQE
jgi:hypothetical protein